MKKKLIALLLSMSMVAAAFAGCGKAEEKVESSKQPDAASSSAEQGKEESNYNATGYPIVDEPIILDVMWALANGSTVADPEKIIGLQMLEEKTNIHLNIEFIPHDDWSTKLNLAMANGDYPDMLVATHGVVNVEDLGVDQEILLPIDEYMTEEFMPIFTGKRNMQEGGLYGDENLIASNGKRYAVPYLYEPGYTVNYMFYLNQTWMDTLGLEHPKNVEELTDVLRAFRDKDPNQNGKADEIPILNGFDSGEPAASIVQLFGVPTEGLYLDDEGQVRMGAVEDGYREFMEWMNLCYNEGLISPEVFTMDRNAFMAKCNEENPIGGFICAWRIGNMGWDPLAPHLALWVPEEACFKREIVSAIDSVYVTSANENVEATMRMVDAMLDREMMFTLFFGPYMEDGTSTEYRTGWTLNEEGKMVQVTNADVQDPSHPYVMANSGLIYESVASYQDSVVIPPHNEERVESGKKYDAAGLVSKYSPTLLNGSLLGFDAETTERMALIGKDLTTALKEARADFIMNGVTDAKWESYVSQMKAIGLEEYIKEYQTAYDNKN